MHSRPSLFLAALLPVVFWPTATLADTCGDYPFSQAQIDYLQAEVPDFQIPEGEVPFVQRCDVDGNEVVDRRDLAQIILAKGEPASHPDDPRDWDGDGVIHGRDVGGCASSCTNNSCSTNPNTGNSKNAGNKGGKKGGSTGSNGLPGGPGACFRAADFDGDGSTDLAAIVQYTGGDFRAFNWDLELLILFETPTGDVTHLRLPWSGRRSADESSIQQHVAVQPAGPVNLMPGSVTIDHPGIVSYRDGVPRELIFFRNNQLRHAFYGIDD